MFLMVRFIHLLHDSNVNINDADNDDNADTKTSHIVHYYNTNVTTMSIQPYSKFGFKKN